MNEMEWLLHPLSDCFNDCVQYVLSQIYCIYTCVQYFYSSAIYAYLNNVAQGKHWACYLQKLWLQGCNRLRIFIGRPRSYQSFL